MAVVLLLGHGAILIFGDKCSPHQNEDGVPRQVDGCRTPRSPGSAAGQSAR
eukprot:CAMPEP_0185181930 /NCGR_PEP_ID=MMETSP1140-20130426/997_1 /TAXON_ID=298111 /ORGANISM="Pavlova sp., Strain CCMP459" /LENGTH=50 /DNA_ID=CAMNT_0027747837 /DNA_START=61 /DNA_END=209 /DNA_ORIENTATION=-